MRVPELEFDEPATYGGLTEEQRQRTFGVPPGRYACRIENVAIGRRRKDGQFVLWMSATREPGGEELFAWQMLSSRTAPLDLTEAQAESLRGFASRLGVTGQHSPEEIVGLLRGMAGDRVKVRVSRTPAGQHATFYRDDESEPVTGEVLPVARSAKSETAHSAYEQLVRALQHVNAGIAIVCEACWRIREAEGWVALGYSSLRELCAQPEVSISASHFYRLAAVWDAFVVRGGADPERLAEADVGKLSVCVAKVASGDVSADDALDDAIGMGVRDLKAQYTEPRDATKPEPRVSVSLNAEDAALLADVLDRAEVLDDVRERLLAFVAENRP